MLFNPRAQRWGEHFLAVGVFVNGATPEGRTTVRLLQLNAADRVAERQRLMSLGHAILPPLT
jgi:hypothetical protein